MHWHEIASALFFVPLMALGVLTILQVALGRKRRPVGDFRLRIQDSVERDICRQFDALFVCMFITDLENQWEERRSSQDWTAKNRQALVREIPLFVDQEFGRDLLAQSMPILGACIRTTYLIYESGHMRDARPEDSGLERSEVVSILNAVVRDYIVDNCFGVEVVDRVVEKKISDYLAILQATEP